MVIFSPDRKETFTQDTQLQNFGTLLWRATAAGHDIIRDTVLTVPVATHGAGTSATPSAGGEVSASHGYPLEPLDAAEMRVTVWERVRALREVYLKLLVLLQLHETLPAVNEAIRVGSTIWDLREQVRRVAAEFFETHWPPNGSFPAPMPRHAIHAAVDVLMTGRTNGLPIYTRLAAEQTNTEATEAIRQLKLSDTTRLETEKRLSNALLSDFALAVSKGKYSDRSMNFVNFKLARGRIHLEAENEFELVFISDFRRFQFERVAIRIGESLGCASNFNLEVAATTTLESASNVVTHTFDALRRRQLYEVNTWKALVTALKQVKEKCRGVRALCKWLESQGGWLATADGLGVEETAKLIKAIDHNALISLLHTKVDSKLPPATGQQSDTAIAEKLSGSAPTTGIRGATGGPPEISTPVAARSSDTAEVETGRKSSGAAEASKDVQAGGDVMSFDSSGNGSTPIASIVEKIYEGIHEMHFQCLLRLRAERRRYQALDAEHFSFDFYRYVIRLTARLSRYVAWLDLRDQARCVLNCQIAPAGLFHVTETKVPRFTKKQRGPRLGGPRGTLAAPGGAGPAAPSVSTSRALPFRSAGTLGVPTGRKLSGMDAWEALVSASDAGAVQDAPLWQRLFDKYYKPPIEDPSVLEEYPDITGDDLPFAGLFPPSAFPTHQENLHLHLMPAVPLRLFTDLMPPADEFLLSSDRALMSDLAMQPSSVPGRQFRQESVASAAASHERQSGSPMEPISTKIMESLPVASVVPDMDGPTLQHEGSSVVADNNPSLSLIAGSTGDQLSQQPLGSGSTAGAFVNRRPAVPQLTFTMDHCVAELTVHLWPISGLLCAFEEAQRQGLLDAGGSGVTVTPPPTPTAKTATGGGRSDTGAKLPVLSAIIAGLQSLPAFHDFYSVQLAGARFVPISSSTQKGFTPQAVDLTKWLTRAYIVIAFSVLQILRTTIEAGRDRGDIGPEWTCAFTGEAYAGPIGTRPAVAVDFVGMLQLHLLFAGEPTFTVWVDNLTGAISINPRAFGSWLQKLNIRMHEAQSYVFNLATSLQQGELSTVVFALAALEPYLKAVPPVPAPAEQSKMKGAQVFTIFSDDDEENESLSAAETGHVSTSTAGPPERKLLRQND